MTTTRQPDIPAAAGTAATTPGTEGTPAGTAPLTRPGHDRPVPVMGDPDSIAGTPILGGPDPGTISPIMGGPDPL
jgi:hypothetical protein